MAEPSSEPRELPLRLSLLGGARVDGPAPISRLEKKTAAMLAYLAMEGTTSRSRIAGLLWPESKEATARNNLAQSIRRLRTGAEANLVVGDESVELRGVTTDVDALLVAVHEGRFADASAFEGELLEGYDLDALPELDAWLKGARGTVGRAWMRAMNAEMERAEREGRFDDAIGLCERALAKDLLSEAAHLRVARLWLAKGDAPAAMNAYERCRKTLARELAMKPSAAMLEVLRAIREGKAPTDVRRAATPVALPASVLRPPWIGRAKEWAELERAAREQRGVVIVGSPGVGKSRLLREFAERRGGFVVVEGRPGDADVPYATLARGLRALLKDKRITLPDWAVAECSRVVPELTTEPGGVPSMRSKLRFFEACSHAVRGAIALGLAVFAVDDLQWVDPASLEALLWIAEQCWSGELASLALLAHRAAELPSDTAARVERLLSAGLVRRVELGPLSDEEALALVGALGIDALRDRVDTIAAASHGVPLFLLEIVRSTLDARDEVGVRIPDRVKGVVRRRLDRLDDGALRLARVAAVAGPSFDLELASHVLAEGALDLATSWSALEAAQVLTGGRLSHDVLAEVLREDLPGVVRELVHARSAEHLVKIGADAALVAQHFEAGAREGDAAPYLLIAGRNARGLSRVSDSTALFLRAAKAFESVGDRSGACDALYQLVRGPIGEEGEAVASRIERLAESVRDRAKAACFRAGVDVDAGRFEAADRTATLAEQLAREAGDQLVLAKAIHVRVDAAIRSGRVGDELDRVLAAFDESVVTLGDPEGLAAAALYHGEVELLRGQPARARPHIDLALEHLARWGLLLYGKARVLAARVRVKVALGDLDGSERDVDEAEAALRDATGAIGARAHVRIARAELCLARKDAAAAFAALGELPHGDGLPRDVRIARVLYGEALLLAARETEADEVLLSIVDEPLADAALRVRAENGRLRIRAR